MLWRPEEKLLLFFAMLSWLFPILRTNVSKCSCGWKAKHDSTIVDSPPCTPPVLHKKTRHYLRFWNLLNFFCYRGNLLLFLFITLIKRGPTGQMCEVRGVFFFRRLVSSLWPRVWANRLKQICGRRQVPDLLNIFFSIVRLLKIRYCSTVRLMNVMYDDNMIFPEKSGSSLTNKKFLSSFLIWSYIQSVFVERYYPLLFVLSSLVYTTTPLHCFVVFIV